MINLLLTGESKVSNKMLSAMLAIILKLFYVAFVSRAVQAGTHWPTLARWWRCPQSPGSPPRCGVGYAAMPLFLEPIRMDD